MGLARFECLLMFFLYMSKRSLLNTMKKEYKKKSSGNVGHVLGIVGKLGLSYNEPSKLAKLCY